jgi:ATP-dependent DNA helicase RecG
MGLQFQLSFSFDTPSSLLTPDEIFQLSGAELLRRLKIKEDRRIERKAAGVQPRLLGEYFSMWANTSPCGGLVIVGMEDDGTLTGCHHLSANQINDREKSGFVFCSEARMESKRVPVVAEDGTDSFVMLFRVFYRDDKVVVNSSGQAFIRIGDSKHELSAEEIRELQIDKGELDFEQELTHLAFPADFDATMVRRYIEALKRERQPMADHTDEELLEHRHLGRKRSGRFVPNNACALLLSKDPMAIFPGCKVRYLRVDGDFERSGEQYNLNYAYDQRPERWSRSADADRS